MAIVLKPKSSEWVQINVKTQKENVEKTKLNKQWFQLAGLLSCEPR